MFVAEDGQKAVDYLGGAGKFADRTNYPLPAVVVLDLKLPFISKHDVLKWIRQQKDLDSLMVIVLTSSNEASELSRCYALGANSYLVKPPSNSKPARKRLAGSGWNTSAKRVLAFDGGRAALETAEDLVIRRQIISTVIDFGASLDLRRDR